MPAVPIVAAVTGASAAVGAAAATAIGLGTVGTVAATAIGSGIIAGATTAVMGGDTSDVLKSAVLGGATSFVGGTVAPAISSAVTEATGSVIAGNVAAGAITGGISAEVSGGDFGEGALLGGLTAGVTSALDEAKLAAQRGAFEGAMTESGLAGQTSVGPEDFAPYTPTTDFTVAPDYSLSTGAMGAPSIAVRPLDTQYQVGSFDYTLGDLIEGLGLQPPSTPNLDGMGGGQGIVLKTKGGYITEQGFIPDSYIASLGDPESFINKPVVDVDLSLEELQQATPEDISGKLAALDIAKALTPYALGALTKKVIDLGQGEGASGFAIVPVPADWRSPEYNMAFTPSAPIDFGTRELLRGTQWENPQITPPRQYTLTDLINTLNMESVPFVQQNYDFTPVPLEVPDILQQFNVAPTVAATDVIGNLNNQPVSIADIIAGIQSGQNYSS